MEFTGVLPPDAPDPRDDIIARVRDAPFTVMGLVPQPSIEDHGDLTVSEGTDGGGRTSLEIGVSYSLWRNPDDRDDPVNLADLDDQTRASFDSVPPWPRPEWLLERVRRAHYPMLWETVRTSWHRETSEYTSLSRQLVEHVNHILMNHFRAELGIAPSAIGDAPWQARESAVNPRSRLEIDGVVISAAEIDTDPFVYGIGARLAPDLVATVVVPRSELRYVRVALATRRRDAAPDGH
jgi:hypothetical protein